MGSFTRLVYQHTPPWFYRLKSVGPYRQGVEDHGKMILPNSTPHINRATLLEYLVDGRPSIHRQWSLLRIKSTI